MSIYKRKSARARKNGKHRYTVVIDIQGEGGKRIRKAIGTYGTRDEAEQVERSALTARDKGHNVAPKSLTVAQMMAEYLGYCKADPERHTAATIETYTLKSKRYIEPKLGSILLSKLQPATVAAWRNELAATIGRRKKPLSPKTVHNVFGLLHAVLALAVGLEYIARNVCDVKAAKPSKPTTSVHAGTALSNDEIRSLLAAAESTRWHSFIVVALATGARRGELCGLSWCDVDFDARKVRIRQSLSQTKGRIELKDTKTHRERVIGLSAWSIEALRRQRVMQAQERLRAPAGLYTDNGAVFTNELGGRVTPMSATKAFARLARAAGISTMRLHDTRHTAASHLIAEGSDAVTVAGVLGHESATITLSIYSHAFDDAKHEATDRLGARMARIASGG
uniref:Site-specific integrase n=1 Tax=mine drainage metagenome TaxID=410659 RepID=E6PBZ2_9ZZZZ